MATWHTGDTRQVLATIPDASVDLVMTSPPFLALRSYLPTDHPDKANEIGTETNPGAFLDVLLDVTEQLARVLAPHGSICVELGDTYSGSGGDTGGDGPTRSGSSGRNRFASSDKRPGWPQAKSLCMVPSTYAWALAYGRNPWTGRETDPWRVRNLIAWCRPNPPVGALGDKFRPATSYMTVACKARTRYFDLDAVREPHKTDPQKMGSNGGRPRSPNQHGTTVPTPGNPAGAPPLDWWAIPTHPYAGSHYATFPPELCVKPIKAMCPIRVCRVCGKPSERIVERTPEYAKLRERAKAASGSGAWESAIGNRANGFSSGASSGSFPPATQSITLGWTDCGHDDWRPGVVLDPFAGSGTTLAVATGLGRDAIGIDIDPRNYNLASQRIGMFLQEHRWAG
jgi:hypothetical protein